MKAMKKVYTNTAGKAAISVILSLMFLFTGSILKAQNSYIYVYSPYAGQITYQNTAVDVTWYSYGADTINLEYTLDNGSTWNTIISNFQGFDYQWTTPDTVTDQCILRISSVADTTVFDETGPFSILEVPTLVLTSPNGGETWNYNEIATVSWTGTNLPYYLYLDYSIDGGSTWNALGSGYSDSTGGTAQVYVPFVSSTNALVKIYHPYYPELISDSSDQPFTIFTPPVIMYYPYEGDEYYIKEETYISWMATGISLVNIDLSTNAGVSWLPVAQNIDADDGYYYWTISGTPSQNCLIRVSDASDPAQFGLSGTFTLLATPVITLNAPAGGEILNTNAPFNISWTYDNSMSDYLYLEYSTNNGQDWNYIDYVMHTETAGSYQWTTPVIESDQCMIRISDYYLEFVSDTSDTFSIITYPATPVCMVTVDSATNRNVIVWEKPVSPLIYRFIVYKESGVAGVYEPIGDQGYGAFSTFIDTNSNPAIKSYRYKLGFSDSAMHIFPAGDMHQTIHLSINKGVGNAWNLIWTDYLGFVVGSYNIYRGSSPADMTLIASISASFTSYTDLDAPVGNVYYMVEVINPGGCTPVLKSETFSRSRSNIATNKALGVNDQKHGIGISVYPNPATEIFNVSVNGAEPGKTVIIEMRDILGQIVCSRVALSGERSINFGIRVNEMPEGIYLLTVSANEKKIVRKIMVRH